MNINLKSTYTFDCYREGKLIWTEKKPNLVTNQGAEYLMALGFDYHNSGVTGATQWYIGLIGVGGNYPVITDTMQDHGFEENIGYTTYHRGYTAFSKTGIAEYTSAVTEFVMVKRAIIKGAFLTTSDNKGGSDGYLYGASIMLTEKNMQSGDVLRITITTKATG
jgi:hypothetical protein